MHRGLVASLAGFVLVMGLVTFPLVGCGAPTSSTPKTEEELPDASPLLGAGWIGDPVDVRSPTERLRVVAFFRPGCLACQHEGRALEKLRLDREDVIVVGVTESEDQDAIANFRYVTTAAYPMLYGLDLDTKEAYEVTYYPSVRVVDARGKIVARDLGYLAGTEEQAE